MKDKSLAQCINAGDELISPRALHRRESKGSMPKALGAEIVEFYLNGWPEKHFVDDSILSVTDDRRIIHSDADNERTATGLPLTDRFDLSDFGVIISEEDTSKIYDFSYFFNRWRKQRDTVMLLVEVTIALEDKVRKAIERAGAKVK